MNDEHPDSGKTRQRKRAVQYENGRFYFTRETERSFYFVLTLIMLVVGIFYKTGIL